MNTVLYIAVLDEFPDFMTPTLVAHSVLWAHLAFSGKPTYEDWLKNSFKKCVLRVSRAEFDKIATLPDVYLGHENNTLLGQKTCAVVLPIPAGSSRDELPNVLKSAKLWKPK